MYPRLAYDFSRGRETSEHQLRGEDWEVGGAHREGGPGHHLLRVSDLPFLSSLIFLTEGVTACVIFRNGLLLENISVKLFCFIFVNLTRRILRQCFWVRSSYLAC